MSTDYDYENEWNGLEDEDMANERFRDNVWEELQEVFEKPAKMQALLFKLHDILCDSYAEDVYLVGVEPILDEYIKRMA